MTLKDKAYTSRQGDSAEVVYMLTEAEMEALGRQQWRVAGMRVCGMKAAEIAAKLHISVSTVKDHDKVIRRAFGADSTAQAIEIVKQRRCIVQVNH